MVQRRMRRVETGHWEARRNLDLVRTVPSEDGEAVGADEHCRPRTVFETAESERGRSSTEAL